MNVIILTVTVFVGCTISFPLTSPNDPNIINVTATVQYINSLSGLTWKASSNGLPETLHVSEFTALTGTMLILNVKPRHIMPTIRHSRKIRLPKNYDSRTAYPQCSIISEISDQGRCGSCYAHAAVHTFSDRLCIHSSGKVNEAMSMDQLLNCERRNNLCKGGYLEYSLNYIKDHGLVTSKQYKSIENCDVPEHYSENTNQKCCEIPKTVRRYYASDYNVFAGEENIRKEIYKNGPVLGGMKVYNSLMYYKKGIYTPLPTETRYGGHAVRIIGWGIENGTNYWLIANSWGKQWGEEGYFRIQRGINLGDVEGRALSVKPTL